MATINDRYQDELIRHAVELERFKNGAADRAIAILNEAEDDLEDLIRRRMRGMTTGRAGYGRQLARLEALLRVVRDHRAAVFHALRSGVRKEVGDFAVAETEFLRNAFVSAAQIQDLFLAAPVARAVRAAATTQPFLGQSLSGWFRGLQVADQRRIESAIRLGFIEGETVDQMVQRIRGTRTNRFRDGILQTTRRNAETIVRTGINHSATVARDAIAQANPDIIEGQVWTAVLDGRTTTICASRDGHVAVREGGQVPPDMPRLTPPEARPPAHPNCRSIMVFVVSPEGLVGSRPFVVDTSTGRARQVRFRQNAKAKAGSGWKTMSESQRRRATARERTAWAQERVGTVPSRTNYESWLRRQPAAFQNEVLGGQTRGALFRRGNLPLDRFIDRSGRRYNLQELRSREASAFREANLIPQEA